MSVTGTVARNTLIQAFGRLIYLVTSIVMIKVLTGYLGEAGFGQYGIMVNYLGFFGVLVDLGLYLIVIQRINQTNDQQEKERAVGSVIALRLVSALVVFGLAAVVFFLLPYSQPGLKWAVAIGCLAFLFVSLTQLFAGILQAFLHAEFVAASEVLGRVVVLASVGVCALLGLGLPYIALALVIGNGVSFLFSLLMARRYLKLKLSFDWAHFKATIKEAAPLGLVLALSYLYVRQDTFVLSLYPDLPYGLENDVAVGIYSAPYRLLETIQGFPALFLMALFPFMSKYVAELDERLKPMYQKAFDVMVMLALPMIVGIVLLAHRIVPFITSGEGWDRSVLVMQILIVAVAFSFLNNFTGHVIIAQKQQKKLLAPNLFFLLVNLVLNLIFIRYWAFYASAAITVLTEGMVVFVNFYIIYKIMGFVPRLASLIKVFLASIVMGVVIFVADRANVPWLVTSLLAMGCYFVALSSLRGAPEGFALADIRRLVRNRWKKR